MRRAPQLGQNPRRLQLKATRCSAWQVSQRARRNPCSRRPHFRKSSNSCCTVSGKDRPCPGQVLDERRVVARDDAVEEHLFGK